MGSMSSTWPEPGCAERRARTRPSDQKESPCSSRRGLSASHYNALVTPKDPRAQQSGLAVTYATSPEMLGALLKGYQTAPAADRVESLPLTSRMTRVACAACGWDLAPLAAPLEVELLVNDGGWHCLMVWAAPPVVVFETAYSPEPKPAPSAIGGAFEAGSLPPRPRGGSPAPLES